jgi:hypothetical protein
VVVIEQAAESAVTVAAVRALSHSIWKPQAAAWNRLVALGARIGQFGSSITRHPVEAHARTGTRYTFLQNLDSGGPLL